MNDSYTVLTDAPEATEEAGERLAAQLRAGDVVLLAGELGAGKTAFVRGVVRGLDSEAHVSSPTFVLIHEYPGPQSIAHVDIYRLSGEADVEEIGIRDYLASGFVTLVEWPERAGSFDWGSQVWRISFDVTGANSRKITVTAPEGRAEQ